MFRWFVGLGIDDRVWDASMFCKNRERFLDMDRSAWDRRAQEGTASAESGAFLGRRDADRGLGVDEVVPA